MKITRFIWRCRSPLFLALLLSFCSPASAQLAPGVRGLATRAPKNMKIDGDLAEFKAAFCTPVEYFSFDPKTLGNRAAQFFYMTMKADSKASARRPSNRKGVFGEPSRNGRTNRRLQERFICSALPMTSPARS